MMHRTRLFTGKPGSRYLDTRFHTQTCFWHPVLEQSKLTEQLPYGPLTAYLLRRFGYPNAGWDDYKQLTKYLLTTGHEGLLMQVVPAPHGVTTICVSFLLEESQWQSAEHFDNRHGTQWENEALDRAESKGLPEWLPEWVEHCNQIILPSLGVAVGRTWREVGAYHLYDKSELAQKAGAFYTALFQEHREASPPAKYLGRPDKIEDWEDADPLKPVALAAVDAMNDLLTPVELRDSEIDALGVLKFTGRARKAAASAGFPSGALGNADPHGFGELHGLIMQLGNGNAKRGIAKATKLIKAASTPKTRKAV